jgi:predicted ATPase/transcriptional regulator with XRE-family HTH domain
MEETGVPFGLWLKRQRRALDLTQEELAQRIGCALVTVRKIEAGERRPSKQILERLAAILSLPPAEQPAFMVYARSILPGSTAPPGVAPGNSEGTPWRATRPDSRANNLPLQLTSFVGREHEMAEVERLLAETRLLTLTGAGGSGKTRLALQVAGGLASEFADGVWWVDLARMSDPALVPQAVASALGMRDEAQRPLLDQLADHLHVKRLLLVLDNCEHLIEACAAFADAFLHMAPKLRILATSREPLAIAGETTYRVPSLQVPDPEHLPPLASLTEFEAVRLFVDRAAAALPGFTVTEANGPSIIEICHRLDGMPLAIELAAARVKVLPVEQIREHLDDRFRLLTGGSRVALPRQQTLRATMDWSFGLLSEPERALFRRLAVFAGGWALQAAEAMCGTEDVTQKDVLDLLARLVDKSLVVLGWQGEAGRYGMLETIRQYASERLEEAGETAGLRRSHAGYFLTLAEEVEPKLFCPEQNTWFARLEAEHSNLRAALQWMADHGEGEHGLRLAGALWRYWEVRGHLAEGLAWLTEMLRLPSSPAGKEAGTAADPATRAKALLGVGVCNYYQRDNPAAAAQLDASLELYRVLGDRQGMASALFYLGWLANDRGDFARARSLLQESVAICREIGDRQGLGRALARLGLVDFWAGDAAAARPLVEQGLALSRELDDKLGTAWWLEMLSLVLYFLGEPGPARVLAEEGVLRCRELGDRRDLAGTLVGLSLAAFEQGDTENAHLHLKEAVVLTRELGDKLILAGAIALCGMFSAWQSQPVRALRLGSAAAALGEAAGFVLPLGFQLRFRQAMDASGQALAADEAAAAWTQGRTMPLEQAIAEALEGGMN